MKVLENVDRRALAGIRFRDETTLEPVVQGIELVAPGLELVRNLSGVFAVTSATGLEEHEDSFSVPPDSPPAGSLSFDLEITDRQERFLPRHARLELPRVASPDEPTSPDSLFRIMDVRLLPAPAAPVRVTWAVLRVSVLNGASGAPIPGALLRVRDADTGELLGRGMSEWRGAVRGEAMVAISGIPITVWGNGDLDGPVIVNEVSAVLEAVVDPAHDFEADGAPDPDALEAERDSLLRVETEVRLASGRTTPVEIEVTF